MHKIPVLTFGIESSGPEIVDDRGGGKVSEERMSGWISADKMNSSVNLTENGKKALLRLSKGDMRRALNILQACHAGYDRVDEAAIYNCTGNPQPEHIDSILNSMLKDEYTTAYQSNTRRRDIGGGRGFLSLTNLVFPCFVYSCFQKSND